MASLVCSAVPQDQGTTAKYTLAEWLDLPNAPRPKTSYTGQLPKLLHCSIRASPLGDDVALPPWLVEANWLAVRTRAAPDSHPQRPLTLSDVTRRGRRVSALVDPRACSCAPIACAAVQAHSGKLGKTFESKFQLVFGAQDTPGHKDNNGTDTHMKLLAGKVLVACWSQVRTLHMSRARARIASKKSFWDLLRRRRRCGGPL